MFRESPGKVVSRKTLAVVNTKIFSHSKSLGGAKRSKMFYGRFSETSSVRFHRLFPIGCMTKLPIHEWLILMVNQGKYNIHGSYGHQKLQVQTLYKAVLGVGFPVSISRIHTAYKR